jgi:hypothetical protein
MQEGFLTPRTVFGMTGFHARQNREKPGMRKEPLLKRIKKSLLSLGEIVTHSSEKENRSKLEVREKLFATFQ